jgi:hypothetical protein
MVDSVSCENRFTRALKKSTPSMAALTTPSSLRFFFFVVAVFGGCVSLVFFFGAVVQFTITFLKVRSQRDKKKSDKQNKHANNNLG